MPDVAAPRPLAHDRFGPAGPGGRTGRGTPVVLLHAFGSDRSMWAPVAERLAAATVPVITIDLPGIGGSPLPAGSAGSAGSAPSTAPAGLEVSAAGVVEVLDGYGIERAVIGGVSMGGYVALALARGWSERLAGLALIDTKAEADGPQARANRERIAQAVASDAGVRALAPMLDSLIGPTSLAGRPEVVAQVRAGLAAAGPEGVAWSQRAMAARPDASDVLPGLHCPVAVVVGEEDGLTPPATARAMAAALPDAVLTVVPRAGHLSPLEAPDDVAAALLSLMLRVRPGSSLSAGPGAG